jgi:hypothetical protein
MSIWSAIAKVGAGALATVFPPALALIPVINKLLPADKQLPADASGSQLMNAYDGLPPEARIEIDKIAASIEIQTVKSQAEVYIAQAAADGQSTRPKIAWAMAQVLSFEIIVFTMMCFKDPAQMDDSILWTVFATLTATPAGLLWKYFGELRKEQGNRTGVQNTGIIGTLTSLIKK